MASRAVRRWQESHRSGRRRPSRCASAGDQWARRASGRVRSRRRELPHHASGLAPRTSVGQTRHHAAVLGNRSCGRRRDLPETGQSGDRAVAGRACAPLTDSSTTFCALCPSSCRWPWFRRRRRLVGRLVVWRLDLSAHHPRLPAPPLRPPRPVSAPCSRWDRPD